jgi:hypothetical protein
MSRGDGERNCRNGCGSEDHGVYASVGGRNAPLTCFAFVGFAAGFGFGVVFGGVDALGGGGGVNGPVCVVVVAGGCSVVVLTPAAVVVGGVVSVGVDVLGVD